MIATSNCAARAARCCWRLMLLTSACASIPDLGPKPSRASATRLRVVKVACRRRASEWPADGWWRRYGDPQLAAADGGGACGLARPRGRGGAAARRGRLRPARRRRAQAAVDAFAVADMSKLSQNRNTPAAAVPNGWNDSGSVGLAFSLDLDLWGKNRAASRAANARRRCGASRIRRSAAGSDHRHRLDLCRSGVALCARDSLEIGAQNPHRDGEARHAAGQDRTRYAGRAEAGRSAHVAGSRRHRGDRRSDRADQERAGRARRRRAGPCADHRPASDRRSEGAGHSRPTRRSTWSDAGRTSPRCATRVEAAAQRIKESRARPSIPMSI